MGKKNRHAGYDEKRLSNLATAITHFRKPIEEGEFPKVIVDLSGLEKAIGLLPSKQRKTLESFWGLVPGSIDHSRHMNTKKERELAYKNMLDSAFDVVKSMLSIEYMYLYEKNAHDLVSKYVKKINRSGYENLPDIDVIKYVLIYWIFFLHGPKMIFEKADSEIDETYGEIGHFDEYSLLNATWEGNVKNMPDDSINLKLLIEMLDMFDAKDVVTMKNFIGLPISRDDKDLATESLNNFKQIRLFKERIFPDGGWNVTDQLIFGEDTEDINVEKLTVALTLVSSNWSIIEEYIIGETTLVISSGVVELPVYEIAGLKFTDPYEIMCLSTSKSLE